MFNFYTNNPSRPTNIKPNKKLELEVDAEEIENLTDNQRKREMKFKQKQIDDEQFNTRTKQPETIDLEQVIENNCDNNSDIEIISID